MARKVSQGSLALARVGETDAQMSARTGAHAKLVNNWKRGHRSPSLKIWRPILKKLYGIEPAAWDAPMMSTNPGQGGFLDKVLQDPAPVAQPERAPACIGEVPSSSLGGGSPTDLAREQVDRILALRRDVDRDPMRTIELRIKAEQACTNMLRQVMASQGANLSESQLVQMPAFRRALDALKTATQTCASCSLAIANALEDLE
jgi:hypothetical protein